MERGRMRRKRWARCGLRSAVRGSAGPPEHGSPPWCGGPSRGHGGGGSPPCRSLIGRIAEGSSEQYVHHGVQSPCGTEGTWSLAPSFPRAPLPCSAAC